MSCHSRSRLASVIASVPRVGAIALLSFAVVGCSPKQTIASWMRQLDSLTAAPVDAPALAQHLNRSGAKMYGAFWCSACRQQEALFGAAAEQLPIVECDPKGKNPQVAACTKAKVNYYPTWEINGRTYPGMFTLTELARMSNYQSE
jgi:hypothetical protein